MASPPKPVSRTRPRAKVPAPEIEIPAEILSTRPPQGHPDYEFPKEVHNLLVTAQSAHVALSSMADSKASILMSATFVVFGLAVGQITTNTPTVSMSLLAVFALISTILSVLAIRPRLLTPPTTVGPKTNLLFFGSFAGLDEEEYIDRIVGILRSEEQTYRTMARDLYQNGRVLQFRKYRYLSHAYTTFLIGLGVTTAAVVVETVIARLSP